ncbi:MAG: hypothetical protein Q8K63_14705, partial [Acidimicrobiales bacterium]|nr:hypothetical protein [Acidimicrobiales bacterium]
QSGNTNYPGDDETYIEVIDLNGTPSVPPLMPAPQIVITSNSNPNAPDWFATRAGDANDVAITRDGAWTVVNSNNWIHVIDATTGLVAKEFNIGDVDYSVTDPASGWNRPCTPNHAVDSVAVSNDRAVVTTARFNTTLNSYTTWVYIVHLTAQPKPLIVLQHEILPSGWVPFGDDVDWPHDVAITYDYQGVGQLAIVTTTHTVAAYDIESNVFRNLSFEKDDRRAYQKQVDSVEVTEKVAVVISDNYKVPGTPFWRVKVFSLSLSGGLQLPPMADYVPANPGTVESHAHDLAIDKDFDKAIVRTSADNVIVLSMLNPPLNPLLLPSPNSSDAYAYEGFYSLSSLDVFSSDSVVISPPLNGMLMAATIGGRWNTLSSRYHGAVDLIDLAAPSPTLAVQVDIAPDPASPDGCVPLDLAVSHDHTEVVIRSVDPGNSSSPTPADLVRVSLTNLSGVINSRFGGHGTVMGLDSLAVPASGGVNTVKRVLSIEQDPATTLGFVHVAH